MPSRPIIAYVVTIHDIIAQLLPNRAIIALYIPYMGHVIKVSLISTH